MHKVDRELLDEKLLELMNVLATEEHYLELMVNNTLELNIVKIRNIRNAIIESMFDLEKTNIKEVWCILKHLLLSYQHSLEIISKTENEETKNNLKNISFAISSEINKIIGIIQSDIKLNECKVCSEDLITNIYKKTKDLVTGLKNRRN